MNLTNQRVVILGGSSGIGLGTARVLTEAGANVIIAGRSPEKVDRALATLEGSVTGEVVDATSREESQNFFRRIGPFDHLVLTLASNEGAGEFRTLDFDMLHRVFEAKFWPQMQVAQASLVGLRRGGSRPRRRRGSSPNRLESSLRDELVARKKLRTRRSS